MAVAALAFALLAYFYYEYVEEGAYDEFEANVSSGKKIKLRISKIQKKSKNKKKKQRAKRKTMVKLNLKMTMLLISEFPLYS